MIEFGFEREVTARTAAWAFVIGGGAFLLLTGVTAVAHFGFGVPINGEARKLPPSRDLMILFALAVLMGAGVTATGVRLLRRQRREV